MIPKQLIDTIVDTLVSALTACGLAIGAHYAFSQKDYIEALLLSAWTLYWLIQMWRVPDVG